ncbi:MAG TPA: hypothetical protein VFS08_11780 [Gemmatimonadaceae bacterium]|nr:hypothetical protein [Gemmatimonadaceae bacterium]
MRRPLSGRVRRGVTLVELCVVITLLALVGGTVVGTLRLQRRAAAQLAGTLRARAVLAHGAAALETELRDVAPADLLVLLDSAVEALVPVGMAVLCAASPGGLLVPADAGDATLAWWAATPRAGDVVRLLRPDSAGGAWSGAVVAGVDVVPHGAACTAVGDSSGLASRRIRLDALPVGATRGAVLWVGRRVRYDLYRGGDGAWQLGRRECAGPRPAPCETVQPVAGPLLAHDDDPSRTGLHVAAVDDAGTPLPSARVASATALRLVLRAPRDPSRRRPPAPAESLVLWLARRNRP